MTDWLLEHHGVIATLASVGTLAIWGVYLHLLLQSHRRQRKPMLLITQGEAQDLSARCLVTNMSQEAVYIQSVVVDLWCGDTPHRVYITDAEDIKSAGDPTGWQRLTRQGPLSPSTMTDMGTFDCILDYLVKTVDGGHRFTESALARDADACEITILGIYGSEDLLIGAKRRFLLEGEGEATTLKPVRAITRQIASRSERRRLTRELAQQM